MKLSGWFSEGIVFEHYTEGRLDMILISDEPPQTTKRKEAQNEKTDFSCATGCHNIN